MPLYLINEINCPEREIHLLTPILNMYFSEVLITNELWYLCIVFLISEILLDNAGLLGPVCCTLLLILTMFLRIVVGVDIEHKRAYFWAYLVFAVVYPFAISYRGKSGKAGGQ
jgi:hypothetical protein